MDKDEDCDRKVCVGADDLFKKGKKLLAQRESKKDAHDCPVDKDELGRNTWSLLHTMSVYYPQKPTDEEKKTMGSFILNLSKVYPCDFCAKDLRKDLKEIPPKLESREEFAGWMCLLHNKVNKKTGKAEFDCSRVFERWRDGWKDGRCE